jgi:hypothetical protein
MSALFDRLKQSSGLAAGEEDLSLCEACGKVIPLGGFGYTILNEGDRIEYRRSFVPWGKLHIHIIRRRKE